MPTPKKTPFCALPFLQLNLDSNGFVLPCCRTPLYVLGNLRDGELLEFWNSKKMKALRREFLTGRVTTCARQIEHLGCDQWNKHLERFVVKAEEQPLPPRKLDVRLNGQCNLECIMCVVWQQPNGVYDETSFWQKGPAEIFPHLLEIEVLGGEPFIQKDTYRLIEDISKVNRECAWLFVTNGHWKFTDSIQSQLDRIKLKRIAVSIDSLETSTYAKIRKKGSLDVVLRNLEALRAYRDRRACDGRPFDLHICMTVQRTNWREMPEYVHFARERGLKPSFIFMGAPFPLSLASLAREERREIHEELNAVEWGEAREWVRPVLEGLLESLEPERRLAHLQAQDRLLKELRAGA